MNKFSCTGRLVADPEVSTFGDNKTKVTFRVAVRKRFVKDGEQDSDFFTFTAFNATADFIAKYFHKGSPILIASAEVHNNNYTKEDGTKVYGTQFIVNDVEFFGKKSDDATDSTDSDDTAAPAAKKEATKSAAKPAPAKTESYDEYDDF